MESSAALTLAQTLLHTHKLPHVKVTLRRYKNALGKCHYPGPGKSAIYELSLSKTWLPYLSPEQVKDIVLHEMAHVLAGINAGHGPAWKAIARKLGATPRARANLPNDICRTMRTQTSKYILTCPTSGCSWGPMYRNRLPARYNNRLCCPHCGAKIEVIKKY